MRKIKYFIYCLIISCQCVAGQQVLACPTDQEGLIKAQQIWEQGIASLGGREKILNIKSILSRDKDNSSVSLDVLPDRFWWWSENGRPIGTDVKTYDFSKNLGYRIRKGDTDNFSYPLTGNSKERILSGLLYTLLETKWIKPKLIGSDTAKIDGKQYDVVCTEVTFPNDQKTDKQITERHDYLFDRVTHLVFRNVRYFDRSICKDGCNYTTEYSGYVDVKGIKFAKYIRDNFGQDKLGPKTEYITDIDVDYRPDLFDKPPSIKDGPDGWKKLR